MVTEYSHSYGLANLTIGAPWFDSNNCESTNERDCGHSLSNGFNGQENLRIRIPIYPAVLPILMYGTETALRMTTPKAHYFTRGCNAKMYHFRSLACFVYRCAAHARSSPS